MTPPEKTDQAFSELQGAAPLRMARHLPSSAAEIASFFLTESFKAAVRFEMGGCYGIDVDAPPRHSGRLRWDLSPAQLQLIAS